MSMPIKMQIDVNVELEGKHWTRVIMLADGSLYADEERGKLNPVDRSFAGHVLKVERKNRSFSYNQELALRAKMRRDLGRELDTLENLKCSSTPNLNDIRTQECYVDSIRYDIKWATDAAKNMKENVAAIENAIRKFKSYSTKANRPIDESKIPAGIKKKNKVVKAKKKKDD